MREEEKEAERSEREEKKRRPWGYSCPIRCPAPRAYPVMIAS